MPYQSLSPATGDLLKSFAEATGPQLEAKLVGASACFAVWRHKSYAERAKIVTKVAALMLDHQEALARTMTIEMGKRVASQIETGMMFDNNLDWADADLPFGGVKTSGYGRELGDMGIQQFVNKKLVGISAAEAPAVTAGKASAASVQVGETT